MNLENYSERVRGFIQSAQTLALGSSHQQFTPEHILKVLVDDSEGMAASLIERAGGNARDVRMGVETALNALPKVEGGNGQLYMSPQMARVMESAPPQKTSPRQGGRQLCHGRTPSAGDCHEKDGRKRRQAARQRPA